MADLNKGNVDRSFVVTGEYGNVSSTPYFKYTTLNVAQDDVVYLGKLSCGTIVTKASLIHGALGTNVTATLGYLPVDGSNPTADNDYWITATAAATAGRIDSEALPKRFDNDVYVVAVLGGAAADDSIDIYAIIDHVFDLKDPA